MGVSTWQIIVILVVILLLFGGKKIPELAQGLGKGIKSFKDAVREGEEEVQKTEKIDNKTTQNTNQNITQDKNVNA